MKQNLTLLASLIEFAYEKDKFIDALIFGKKGCGKSVYALITAYQVYRDWDLVFDHLIFNPLDALKKMKDALESNERIKVLVFDDAGLWLGRLEWWENHKVKFSEFYNVIRDVCAGVIYTSPADDICGRIVKHIGLRLMAEELDEEFSKIRVYKVKVSPLFQQYVKTLKEEIYRKILPDDIYERYRKMKRKATAEKLREWAQTLSKKDPVESIKVIKEIYIPRVRDKRELRIIKSCSFSSHDIYADRVSFPRQLARDYNIVKGDLIVWLDIGFPIGVPDQYYEQFMNMFFEKKVEADDKS